MHRRKKTYNKMYILKFHLHLTYILNYNKTYIVNVYQVHINELKNRNEQDYNPKKYFIV